MRAAKICMEPGCPRVATDHGRCRTCDKEHLKQKYARVDEARLSAGKRGYDYMHRKWRAQVLERDPTCKWLFCLEPATVADHIKPISEGGSRFNPLNGQGLCDYHHNVKRQQESIRARKGGGFSWGSGAEAVEKMALTLTMIVLIVMAYLVMVGRAYAIIVARTDRFKWHSHPDYYCHEKPCHRCDSMLWPMAIFWPVILLAWLMLRVVIAPLARVVMALVRLGERTR